MPIVSPGSSPPGSVPWAAALAAASVLLVGGGAIIWAHREPPAPEFAGPAGDAPATSGRPGPPHPFEVEAPGAPTLAATQETLPIFRLSPGLQAAYAVEHGRRVVKIRVVPDGDELVVDAATGRLIETRPGRPTAPFVPPT